MIFYKRVLSTGSLGHWRNAADMVRHRATFLTYLPGQSPCFDVVFGVRVGDQVVEVCPD